MNGEKKGKQVNRRQFLKKAGEATAIGAITVTGIGAFANPSGVQKLIKAMAEQVPAYSSSTGHQNGSCPNYGCLSSSYTCTNDFRCPPADDFHCNEFNCQPSSAYVVPSGCLSSSFTCTNDFSCPPADNFSCNEFSCQPTSAYVVPE